MPYSEELPVAGTMQVSQENPMDDALSAVLVLLSRHLELPPTVGHVHSSGPGEGGAQATLTMKAPPGVYSISSFNKYFRFMVFENILESTRKVIWLQSFERFMAVFTSVSLSPHVSANS